MLISDAILKSSSGRWKCTNSQRVGGGGGRQCCDAHGDPLWLWLRRAAVTVTAAAAAPRHGVDLRQRNDPQRTALHSQVHLLKGVMSAQGLLSSVFSCSPSPKSISKRRLRQTRSLDPVLMRHYDTEAAQTLSEVSDPRAVFGGCLCRLTEIWSDDIKNFF